MPEADDNPFLIDNSAPPPVARPRTPYDEIIERHAKRTGIDPNLIRAVMGQESSSNPTAVSPKGARGLMQLMPGTAARYGVTNISDPEQNIRGGTDYLKFLNDKFQGNTDLVLAGYNAGEGAVEKYGNKVPPYRETQQYVPAVKARYQKLTGQSKPQDQNPFLIDSQKPAKPNNPFLTTDEPTTTESPEITEPGRGAGMARATASPAPSVRSPSPLPLTTNDAAWHFGMTPEEAKRLTPKARKVLADAVAGDAAKKAQGKPILPPPLKYQNDMRKAAGLKPLKFNIAADENAPSPFFKNEGTPFSTGEKPPVEVKPRPFTFASPSDEDIKSGIRQEVLAAQTQNISPEARSGINQTDVDNIVNERFKQFQDERNRTLDYARLGPRFEGRNDSGERARTAISDLLQKYAPGLANIDTPGGLKTDAVRAAIKSVNVIPGPQAEVLSAISQPREVTSEERLLDPQADANKKLREYVGAQSTAFIPFIAAGKAASLINNPIVRDAVTFGTVELGRQLSQNKEVDPQALAESILLGGAMGKIVGADPTLKRRLVGYVAPALALGIAKGEKPEQLVETALTNGLFAAFGGKESEPKTAAELLSRRAEPTQTVPEELQAKLAATEPQRAREEIYNRLKQTTVVEPKSELADVFTEPEHRLTRELERAQRNLTQYQRAGGQGKKGKAMVARWQARVDDIQGQLDKVVQGKQAQETAKVEATRYSDTPRFDEWAENQSGQRVDQLSGDEVQRLGEQYRAEFASAPSPPVLREMPPLETSGPDTRFAGLPEFGRESTQPVRHVDLQTRRVRGEGKGRFKTESRAQREDRRTQVEQSLPIPEQPAERSNQPLQTSTEVLREPSATVTPQPLQSQGAQPVKTETTPSSPAPTIRQTGRRFTVDRPIASGHATYEFKNRVDAEAFVDEITQPARFAEAKNVTPLAVKEEAGEAKPFASQPAEAQNIPRGSPITQTQKNVVQPEVREPRQPKSPAVSGAETRVSIPDSKESYPARYEVREAADVYSSHDPVNFQPNPDYYHENDRRYDQEKQYQAQVIDRAKNLDPSQLINNAPTPELGPPIIDEDGNALGGNSRTMIIKRAYRDANPQAREAYRKALAQQASVYGVDPAKIEGMKTPVLVRVLSDQGLEKDVQQTITELNRSSVTPLTREEQVFAGASRMSESSADFISRRIERHGEDGTLANAMNDSGAEIVNKLIEDGVLSPGERNTLLKNGKATPEAKTRVERLLTGRIYDDVAQMERTPSSVRNNIERAAPALLKIENSEWDIGSDLKRAIDATTEARSSGMTLDEVQKQTSMVRAPFTDRQIAIAKVLSEGPRKATVKFQAYAGEFDNARQGGGLFGARSPGEAFAQHFEGKTPTIEEPSLIKAAREREAKRTEEKQQGIEYRHAGADPYELIDKMLIKGYELYKKGRPKFNEWAKRMRAEFGKDIESHLSDIYARITASQSVSDSLRKARSLPKTLETSGRAAGTDLEYDVLPNPVLIGTVADRIAKEGIDKTEEWYRNAEPTPERTEAFRQIGDQLLTQAVNEKDSAKAQALIERGTDLANIEAPRSTTLGQTVQAYSINTRYSPSGALMEATKLAERSKAELSKEDRDFIVRKAVEHQEADTNINALREQIDLFPDVNRKPKTIEERIRASSQGEQVIHGAVQLLKDRDMGRGEFYREMKKKFGLSHEESTNVFQKSYRLLKDSRKANAEENKLAGIRKANPTATEQRVQELYDHLNNEVKRRREAKMELARAFARLEKTNRGWWHRLLNLQRGLLVSTFPTAIRNAQTQFQRLGVEGLTDAVETTLRKALRLDSPMNYSDAWSHIAQGFNPHARRNAEAILQEFPAEHEQVFGRYASDVEMPNTGPLTRGAETLLGKAEQGVALLNWANTLQEFHLRGAEFLAKLNQELKARGLPPAETYLRRGNSEDIPIQAIKRASKAALEVTFADKPNYNTVADALIKVGNQIPASVSPIPFPRFFYNSMKFLYQYNPTGLVDLARKSTENRPRVVAKAMVGTAMLLTAYGLRGSDYAGEKWYELRVPGTDRLVDMRPFGPFSLYLFLAEAIRRGIKKQAMRPEEILAAIGIGGSRGDSPWTPIGRTYDLLTTGSQTKRERAWKALKSEGGEGAASLLTPVRQVKDIVAQFDKSEAVRRNTDVEPFLGPIKETIPYANRNAKPVYTGTSKEPVQQDYPLLKTLSGYRVEQQKNFIQKELDRLRFTSQEITDSTGIPEIDTRTKELMGQIVGTQAEKLQYNRGYQQAGDGRKALILREMLRKARTAAGERAEGENPGLARKLQTMRQSQRDQDAGVPAGGGSRRSPFQSRPLERPTAP